MSIDNYTKKLHSIMEDKFCLFIVEEYLYKHKLSSLYVLLSRIQNNKTLGTEVLDILSEFESIVFQIEHYKEGTYRISKNPGPHDKTILLKYTPNHWTPIDKKNTVIMDGSNNCLLTSLARSEYKLEDRYITREILQKIVLKLISMVSDITVEIDNHPSKKQKIGSKSPPSASASEAHEAPPKKKECSKSEIKCKSCTHMNSLDKTQCVSCDDNLFDKTGIKCKKCTLVNTLESKDCKSCNAELLEESPWTCTICKNINTCSSQMCLRCMFSRSTDYIRPAPKKIKLK